MRSAVMLLWKEKADKKSPAKKVYTVNFLLSLPANLRYNF